MSKKYEHRSASKKNLTDFLSQSNFGILEKQWNIQSHKDYPIKDRIEVLIDDPNNPYEMKDITPFHLVNVLKFNLKCVNHNNFNFLIYDDYENEELIYFRPAVYYYGNFVKDYVYSLIMNETPNKSFLKYCEELKNNGDNFSMHNYKIDMETAEKFDLMR